MPKTNTAPSLSETTTATLDRVERIYDDYLIFPSDAARDAVVLWIAHTHVFLAFESTPRLSVWSTEPGSGKSRVLEVMEHLVPAPMYAINITPACMWRTIEHESPTLLLDEVDTIWGQNGSSTSHQTLRGILNAGHRAGATLPRTSGAEDVKRFNVFAPVAMAGLGDIPDTVHTRSVRVNMRKRKGDQEVKPFRLKYAQDVLRRAREELEMWAMEAADVLEYSEPDMPVKDRDADVWEPLFAIAELAGGDWPERVRRACEELTADASSLPQSPGMRLLTELKAAWPENGNMATDDMLSALHERGYSHEVMNARSLARMLTEYDLRPVTVKVNGKPAKGYRRADMMHVWEEFKIK